MARAIELRDDGLMIMELLACSPSDPMITLAARPVRGTWITPATQAP